MSVCATTSCAVFCVHTQSATRESCLPASEPPWRNDCTGLSIQSSSNMIADLCGSFLLLPVSQCSCRDWHMIATQESSSQCLYLNPFATSLPVLLRWSKLGLTMLNRPGACKSTQTRHHWKLCDSLRLQLQKKWLWRLLTGLVFHVDWMSSHVQKHKISSST